MVLDPRKVLQKNDPKTLLEKSWQLYQQIHIQISVPKMIELRAILWNRHILEMALLKFHFPANFENYFEKALRTMFCILYSVTSWERQETDFNCDEQRDATIYAVEFQ